MSLTIGTPAPDFTLTTKNAEGLKEITLSAELAHGPVVLLFFPMAFTSVCTTEFCDVSQGLAQYESLKARVFGISGDNPFAQEAWATKEGIKVTLLSDYEHGVAKAYGVAYESFLPQVGLPMGGVPKRSAFVIDGKGIIQYAESSDDPKQLPDFAAILAKLAELNS
jgi:peroxiredoxin